MPFALGREETRPVFLAPMEDVTDIGFRMLCKRFGAPMVYTEFVSAEALVRSVKSTVQKLTISDDERPVGIQIYGRDVAAMVEAARIVEQAHPDVIDLNFGCPVKKVAGKGAGAGMLRNIPLLLEITREVVKAVNTPVTVKTRLGWDQENLIIEDLAEALQDCGIKALTIHGRTRSQMYTGDADWTLIGRVKQNPRIRIPIIGNGDIRSAEDAQAAFERYGVDAVMVGRATFGRPWLFKEIRSLLDTGVKQTLTTDEKIDVLEEQLRINIERIDEYRGILHTRRHLAATPVFKGIPDFRQTRIRMLQAETAAEPYGDIGILSRTVEKSSVNRLNTMDINEWITAVNDAIWGYVLIAALVGCGVWFTVKTRFVQFRMLFEMIRLLTETAADTMTGDRKTKHISPFQAFAVSVATRVGTGNLAGVAAAIAIGGPGSVFWMWVIALIGAATAFVESTLAQLFKQPHSDSFIGGPAYYIQKGLHKRWMAVMFAVFITLQFGLSNISVQSSTICSAMHEAFGWSPVWVGVVLTVTALFIVFGGIQRIAKVSAVLVPVMAVGYVVLALVVMVMNIQVDSSCDENHCARCFRCGPGGRRRYWRHDYVWCEARIVFQRSRRRQCS